MDIVQELKEKTNNIKVLYVEDNEVARNKTVKVLKRVFKNIDVAVHGKDGLSLFMKHQHDLVISDIIMNVMDGLEMVQIIKNINPEQNIIFLSAYTEQKFLSTAIELSVDGFVFKPIDTDKFYKAVLKSVNLILLKKENQEYKKNLEQQVKDRTADLVVKNYELQEMIKEVQKVNQLKEEMKVAQRVQENFLPKKLPESNSMQVATFFEAAQYVGGDYYDLFSSKNKTINIIIADVSGHGIVPAITMSTFRGVCRSVLTLEDISFEQQVEVINDIMSEDAKHNEFFITAFFIKYYEDENRFEYISAGHNEIIFYNNISNELEKLKSTAIPLAIFENTKYKLISKQLNRNDFLVLYTDGLIEALNKDKKMFELQRLIDIIDESKTLDADEVLVNIQTALNEFIEGEAKADDTTILVTKFV